MTVQTKINRAFRLSGILAKGQTLDSDDSADALEALNDMLANWATDYGAPVSSGGLALSDSFPYDSADERAIVYNLAMELYPEYGAPINPIVAGVAEETLNRIKARYMDVPDSIFDNAILNNTEFDITTG